MRFDFFVSKRLNISRNKALELVENEKVLLNGKSYIETDLSNDRFYN